MFTRSGFFDAVPNSCRIALAMVIFLPLMVYGQFINVIRITGNTAVISEGTNGGFHKGDRVKISRLINNGWLEITTGDVVSAEYNQSTVQWSDGATAVKLGDKAERMEPPPVQKKTKAPVAAPSQNQTQPSTRRPSTVPKQSKSTSNASGNSPTRREQSVYQGDKRVYLGPQIGAFIPVGNMADGFKSVFGYGGVIGAQFRKNMDVCLQFLFAAKKDEWSFWNLQLLARRYLNQNVIFDFGYGISYPEYMWKWHGPPAGGGNIQLGLSAGLSYGIPINGGMSFEIGALYQYYPNFGEKAGQFLNMQGRLLL